jgi:hypothetical protein
MSGDDMSDVSLGGAARADTVMIWVKYIEANVRVQHGTARHSGNSLLPERIFRQRPAAA